MSIISRTKIVIEIDINECSKLYNWSIFNDIVLKDGDKICNEFKLMTNLSYMTMKFIIWDELLVAELTIENNQNFFNEHDVRCVLIVIQIIIIVFFLIYILFNFDENDVVNDFLKRLVVRFIIIILFIFEVNFMSVVVEQQKFIFEFNVFDNVVINTLRLMLSINVN